MLTQFKRFTIIFFTLFLLISCSKPAVQLVQGRTKTADPTTDAEANKPEEEVDNKLTENEFVFLFFPRRIIKTPTPKRRVITSTPIPTQIDPNQFKVIVDYQIEGGRFIKLRNNQTGQIYEVKDFVKTGEVVLLERTYFYYTFKIKNQIVKVKR